MAKKLSDFEQAFADARDSGEEVFTFKGEKYHTRRADETPENWMKGLRKRKQALTDKQYEASKPVIKPLRPQDEPEGYALPGKASSSWSGKVKRAE
jgi:hypothetical protein